MNPQAFLTIEASTFSLNDICVDSCIPNPKKYTDLAVEEEKTGAKDQNFEKEFRSCLEGCVVSFLQTREYLKDKFMRELDETQNKNEEIYNDYYK